MMTIFKGALAAFAIAGASLFATAPAAQADVGIGVGIYADPGYVSVGYRDRSRCGYYDRYGYYHRYRHCRYGYYRPYHRAYYRSSYCYYHPYSYDCRYYRW